MICASDGLFFKDASVWVVVNGDCCFGFNCCQAICRLQLRFLPSLRSSYLETQIQRASASK